MFTRSAIISFALAALLFAAGSFEALALVRGTSRAGRDGLPPIGVIDDERVYLFQARMLASGRLSAPPPPMPEMFEALHVLVTPRFAGKYLPGHPLVLAPFAALGAPWLGPALLLGLYAAALFFAARASGFSRIAALLCGALPLCTQEVASLFLTYLSWTSSLAISALTLGCLLRWTRREEPTREDGGGPAARPATRIGWLVAASALAGFCVWVRPYTGVALTALCGLAALSRLRASSSAPVAERPVEQPARRERTRVALAFALPILLWGALTALVCREVTGRFTELPWSLYARQYMPGDGPGFGDPHAAAPERHAPDHLRHFIDATRELRRQYTPARMVQRLPARAREIGGLLPSPFLVPLALLGLLLCARTLWPALAFALLFFALQLTFYAPTFFYLTELAAPLALGLAALAERLARAIAALERPAPRLAALPAMLLATAAVSQAGGLASRSEPQTAVLRHERALLPAAAAHGLVFLHYPPGVSLPELNYNDPDIYTAPMIRALDLGPRDELARLFPQRPLFLYDVARGQLVQLPRGASR